MLLVSVSQSHKSCCNNFSCNRYKHVPGVIHIKRDDLLLKHRPWHTMLRSSVGDHSMMKYSSGIYKHMPGGLESLPSFFHPKPVTKLCETICKASCKRGRASSQQTNTGVSHSACTLVCIFGRYANFELTCRKQQGYASLQL